MPPVKFVDAPSSYASRIPVETWSLHEPEIRVLHAAGKNRTEIRQILLQKRGFNPSPGQLTKQYAKWGLTTYVTKGHRDSDEEKQDSCGDLAPVAPYEQAASVIKSPNNELGLEHEIFTETALARLSDPEGSISKELTDASDIVADSKLAASFLPPWSQDDASGANLGATATLAATLKPCVEGTLGSITERCPWLQCEQIGIDIGTWSDKQMLSLATIMREIGSAAAAFEVLHEVLARKCKRGDFFNYHVLSLVTKCAITAKLPMQRMAVRKFTWLTLIYLKSITTPELTDFLYVNELLDQFQKVTDHIFAGWACERPGYPESTAPIEKHQKRLGPYNELALDVEDYRDLSSSGCMKRLPNSPFMELHGQISSHARRVVSDYLVGVHLYLRKTMKQHYIPSPEPWFPFPDTRYKPWIRLYLHLSPRVESEVYNSAISSSGEAMWALDMSEAAALGVISRLVMPDELSASVNSIESLPSFLQVAESRLFAVRKILKECQQSQIDRWLWNHILDTTLLNEQVSLSDIKYVCQCLDHHQARPARRKALSSFNRAYATKILEEWSGPPSRAASFTDHYSKLAMRRQDLEKYTTRLKQSLGIEGSRDTFKPYFDTIREQYGLSVGRDQPLCPSLASSDFQRFEASGIERRQYAQVGRRMGRTSTGVPSVIRSLSVMSIDESPG